MIPIFEEFMLPFLQCLADEKERNKKEMDEAIASYFNLTEEEKKESYLLSNLNKKD